LSGAVEIAVIAQRQTGSRIRRTFQEGINCRDRLGIYLQNACQCDPNQQAKHGKTIHNFIFEI
jgi:hypothetical protein